MCNDKTLYDLCIGYGDTNSNTNMLYTIITTITYKLHNVCSINQSILF